MRNRLAVTLTVILMAATMTARAAVPADPLPDIAATAVGMWTSTGRQTNADGLCWNEQVAGDADVFDWAPGDSEIRIVAPGTYIIQTRIPVYGTPGQSVRPYAGLTVSTGAEQVNQTATATKLGDDVVAHLLVFVKAQGAETSYLDIGFGADEGGWTQGAVVVIARIK